MRHRSAPLLPLLLAACTASCDRGSDPSAPAKAASHEPAVTTPKTTPTHVAPPLDHAPTSTTDELDPVPAAEPAVVAEVAAGFDTFGLELYRSIATTPGNLVISPASIAIALAMTHAGARGETAKEIATALHYPRAAPIARRAVATLLRDFDGAEGGIELAVANRLFGEATLPVEASFQRESRRSFGAPLEPVDFIGAHEPARERINGWVAERTHDRIEDLLPAGSLDASTRLVLVNALYFKAKWMTPFPERLTAPAPFHAATGPHDVATMHVTRSFAYAGDDDVQVVTLPYADARYTMTLVVPAAVDGLAAIEGGLDAQSLRAWDARLAPERIALALPKFRIAPDEALRLSAVLGDLGIRLAFGPQADLTGIAPASEQLRLSEAYHKGFIEVDEHGTEAAAATAVVGRAGSAPPREEPRVVKIDRPFLYFVRDTQSGLVLFMGRVVDPVGG